MEIDDAILVDLVRQFPVLYDKGNKDFKNKNIKENAWGTIASTLNTDVNLAQTRWIVLRNRYGVERKEEKNMPSGSGPTKPWPLFSAMFFLEKHMTMRKTTGNMSSPMSQCSDPLRSMSPWNSLNIIMDNTDDSTQISGECSTHSCQDSLNESCEISDSPIEISEEPGKKREQHVGEHIPLPLQKMRESKNETPPLKKRRKRAEEGEIMAKLSSAFDSFTSYLKSKSNISNSKQNLECDSTINFLKSVGNDLLQIKNKRIRYETEIEIMQIVKKAVCDDMSEED